MITLVTNFQSDPIDERCQAFFNYPGISAIGLFKEHDSTILYNLHNRNVQSKGMVINCSERVFVYDIDQLIEFMMFLTAQENCEVMGFTMEREKREMGAEFNILVPKTHINRAYFNEVHDRKIDCYIRYERHPEVPGWLLLNHADIPFAIYSGQIKGERRMVTDIDSAHAWAVRQKNEINEWNKDALNLGKA